MTSNLQKLRISIVQYLNTAPLVWGFTNGPLAGKYELSFTVPSQCAEALRSGAADIAIIPAIEYQRIPGLVVLPDLAIASQNRRKSQAISVAGGGVSASSASRTAERSALSSAWSSASRSGQYVMPSP